MDTFASTVSEIIKLHFKILLTFAAQVANLFFPRPPKSVKNEIILVTGGSNGIGKQILLRLAQIEPEATLISWDIDEKGNEAILKELQDCGVKRAFAYTVDITDRKQVTKAAEKTRQDAGEVTMLYNNAGIAGPMGKSWAIDAKHYLKTLDVNLNSHLFMIQEFLPSMLRNNKGHIIATCSILSFLTGAHGTSYVVSKHAVRALYECIKADIRKAGAESDIMITSVYPGFAATDLVAQFDFHSRNFPFLTNTLTAQDTASQVVDGVLKNKEHIYVQSFWRHVHTYMSILPAKWYAHVTDAVDIDPLRPRLPTGSA